MPKTLTEADLFTSPIVVPEGDDDMDDAATVVETFVQSLVNRTYYLNTRSGKLAGTQTWTGVNTYNEGVTVKKQLTLTPESATSTPLLIGNPTTYGNWQKRLAMRAGSNQWVYVFTGGVGATLGALAITYNTEWNGTNFSQINTGEKSIALIWRYNDVRLVTQPAGTAPWSVWPQNTVSAFGAEMLSEIFRGARMVANGNTDADRTNGFRYPSPIARLSPVPLHSLWGNVQINAAGHIMRAPVTSAEYDQIWIPIRIPTYCSFQTVKVHFMQLQSSQPDEFQLMRRQGYQAWTPIGTPETHGSYGDTVALLHSGYSLEVMEGYEWAYRWKVVSGDPAVQLNRIIGVEIEWTDIGPNNRVG